MSIRDIDRSNKALWYIEDRIKDSRYRGEHRSQHNRYGFDKSLKILECLNKFAPTQQPMQIRTVDVSKRPHNLPEEEKYAQFCNSVKTLTGIGTQDAMRKNLFLDFHRMGFIERYDKNLKKLQPSNEKQSIKYVSLSALGLSLINRKNIQDKYFVFAKGIDILLKGIISNLIEILTVRTKISVYEIMFFVTAIDLPKTEFSFSVVLSEAMELIKQYNNLGPIKKKSLIKLLTQELEPQNYRGNKTNKRDFHNWKNESQQILSLLKETPYFEVRNDEISLSTNKNLEDIFVKRLNRSLGEKISYFKNHEIKKSGGFELHHIVPLSWAESIHHFKLLDNWKNMLYIDGFSHSQITQNGNRNVKLYSRNKDFILCDFRDGKLFLLFNKNVLYSIKRQKELLNYNDELLKGID